jgi:endo-1,4-beta-xylanase
MTAAPPRGGAAAGPARRRVLKAGLAAGIAMALPAPSLAAAPSLTLPRERGREGWGGEPLRRLAATKGLVYGTTISAAQIRRDPAFVALVLHEAGLVVPENDMKWQFMNRGAPGDDDFGPADRIVDFAVENGLVLRGHNLLWYHRTPRWFFDLPSRAAKERAIVARIQTMAGRYRGKIHSWDVVNEPIEPKDGRPDGLRKAVFLEALGPEYLDLAYRTARAADPKARLVVNEYDIELDAPEQEARRAALLALLRRMRAAATPVDAVGIQAHLRAVGGAPLSVAKLRRFLAEIAALGLEIEITELDVTDEMAPAAIEARDGLVADAYRRFLDAVLVEPAVKMIVTWGLSDRYSWIVRKEINETRQRRDGLPSRPLPFDAGLQPKPACRAMAEAFTLAPSRNPG